MQISIGFPRKDGATERLVDAIHTVSKGSRAFSCCSQVALLSFQTQGRIGEATSWAKSAVTAILDPESSFILLTVS